MKRCGNAERFFDPLHVARSAYDLRPDQLGWARAVGRSFGPLFCETAGQETLLFDTPSHELVRVDRAGSDALVGIWNQCPGLRAAVLRAGSGFFCAAERLPTPVRGHLAARWNLRDIHLVVVQVADAYRLLTGVPLRREHSVPRTARAAISASIAHIENAIWLRNCIPAYRPKICDVLGGWPSSDPGRAPPNQSDAAELIDALEGGRRRFGPVPAGFWSDFLAGRWWLLRRYELGWRRYFVLCDGRTEEQSPAVSHVARSVFDQVTDGQSNREIGRALGLTDSAVARQIAVMKQRLTAGRRSELIGLKPNRLEVTFDQLGSAQLAIVRWVSKRADEFNAGLSDTLVEVLALLLSNHTAGEIAVHRGVSKRTTEHQVALLLRKFSAPRTARLLALLRDS